MSEIKGQLLGIVLVVSIFGAVAGVLLAAFNEAASNTANKIKEEPQISTSGAKNLTSESFNEIGNLVF